jgi:hypothetical protein
MCLNMFVTFSIVIMITEGESLVCLLGPAAETPRLRSVFLAVDWLSYRDNFHGPAITISGKTDRADEPI